MDHPVLLHVGYHKTGTTWLQQCLFGHPDSGFEWIGRPWEARKQIVAPHPLAYDPSAVRAYYQPDVDRATAAGRVAVFSDERFSGNPHSGGYDSKEIAARLAATFPAARVLMVVRRQQDMLFSTYDQYVNAGGACSLQDYLSRRTRYSMPMFSMEHFQYHRLIELYQRSFGRGRVVVLAYEQLNNDGPAFARRIMEFSANTTGFEPDVERRMNVGRPAALTPLQRRLNLFMVRDDLNGYSILAVPGARRYAFPVLERIARLVPHRIDRQLRARIRAEINAACRGVFGTSNRATAELTGLDLACYGYDMN
jgi:hypothetical protein